MTRRGAGVVAAIAATAALALAACSSGGGSGDASTPPASGSTVTGTSPASTTAGSGTTGATSGSSGAGTANPTSAPYPTSGPVPKLQDDQSGVLNALPGSPAPTCGAVGTQPQLRADGIAAGNFVTARTAYHAHGPNTTVTLFVIPQLMTGVTSASVTVSGLNGQSTPRTTTSTSRSTAEAWTYFPVPVTIGAPGPYRLSITAGSNRGCFDVSFS